MLLTNLEFILACIMFDDIGNAYSQPQRKRETIQDLRN